MNHQVKVDKYYNTLLTLVLECTAFGNLDSQLTRI